jgi:hypothetical protein
VSGSEYVASISIFTGQAHQASTHNAAAFCYPSGRIVAYGEIGWRGVLKPAAAATAIAVAKSPSPQNPGGEEHI